MLILNYSILPSFSKWNFPSCKNSTTLRSFNALIRHFLTTQSTWCDVNSKAHELTPPKNQTNQSTNNIRSISFYVSGMPLPNISGPSTITKNRSETITNRLKNKILNDSRIFFHFMTQLPYALCQNKQTKKALIKHKRRVFLIA